MPVSYAFVTFEQGEPHRDRVVGRGPGPTDPPRRHEVHGITDERAAGGQDLDEALGVITSTLQAAGRSGRRWSG